MGDAAMYKVKRQRKASAVVGQGRDRVGSQE